MKKAISITIFIIIIMFFLVVRNSNVNASDERTILFIGNSRTYYNNLPEKVCKLAEQDGNSDLPDLTYTAVTKGDKTLKWFYDERETYKDKLLSNKWDYIVLQEGMDNALNDDKLDEFKNGAKDIIEFLKQNNCADENTTIIYHATWVKGKKSASSANYSVDKLKTDQKQFNEHYRVVKDYVEQETGIKGKIAYSGDNFISAIEELGIKVNSLYKDEDSNDSIHPTNAGSYLAACTIYETIFQTQVKDFSGEGTANSYDNILDNTYTGTVSSASAGTKTKVGDLLRQQCQYITRKYVDITQPVISDIIVSNEEWTNMPVIIEFKADDNIYKIIINGEEAQSNDDGTYSFSATSNGAYNIKVIDLVGHESEITKNISNIDTTLPTEMQPLITCTTNSIKVTNQQEDKESGIDESKTKYRLTDENGTIGEWQTSNGFEGLTTNNIYYVQTQVTDKAGNTRTSEIISVELEDVPELNDENTTIQLSNSNWTKDDVTVQVTTSITGYELQTKVGENGAWSKETTIKLIENNTIYVRLTDGVNISNELSKKINNIDKTAPTQTHPLATSTTKSIKVINQQEDKESGIDESKTKYRLTDENGTIGEWKTSNTFEGLTANKTYYIQTQVVDKAGNSINSEIVSINTKSIPKIDNMNTSIQVSNTKWTKNNVTVQVTTSITGYELQTKVGEKGTWSNNTTIKLSENNIIYIRLADGVNTSNELSKKINNIDKTAPTQTHPLVSSTTKSIKVTNQQEDKESGIDETKIRYRLTDEKGSIGEWQTSNVFEGLFANQTYYVQTQATDNVGNASDSEIIIARTNEIPNLNNLNTRFKSSNENWTNKSIEVEIEIIDEELLKEINSGIYSIQTYVEEFGKEENKEKDYKNESKRTLETNGRIYVRLTNGIDMGNEYVCSITNIDKKTPIILGIENDAKYSEHATITDIIDEESGIKKVELTKNKEKVEFTVGEPITEVGVYKLTVIDNAKNSTSISFEIVKNENIDNNNNNNESNVDTDPKDNVINDNTTVDKDIPKAGKNTYIILGIIISGIMIIKCYMVLKKYENIK